MTGEEAAHRKDVVCMCLLAFLLVRLQLQLGQVQLQGTGGLHSAHSRYLARVRKQGTGSWYQHSSEAVKHGADENSMVQFTNSDFGMRASKPHQSYTLHIASERHQLPLPGLQSCASLATIIQFPPVMVVRVTRRSSSQVATTSRLADHLARQSLVALPLIPCLMV